MTLISMDVNQRVLLLKNLPLFSQTPQKALQELAILFREVGYATGTIVVQENEPVDTILVIAEGKVEVTKSHEILAILQGSESIGLNDTGFYSTTGVRTATVTALTPLIVLQLEMSQFNEFLHAHSDILPHLQEASDDILLQILVKKIEPFAQIDLSIIQEIKSAVVKKTVPSETIIFCQGDMADNCYLLCSGKVTVSATMSNGLCQEIAELNAVELFGELALLTNNKRNATIKTLTECELMVLHRDEFEKLAQHSSTEENSNLMSMLLERHRPQREEGITIHTREDAEKNTIVILKNATKGSYIKISEPALFVWNLLDGDHTLKDITMAYFYEFHKLAIEPIGNLIMQLMQSGFVTMPVVASFVPRAQISKWQQFLLSVRSVMEYQYSVRHVDQWVTQLYQRVGYLFFKRISLWLMAAISIVGFFAVISTLHQAAGIIHATSHAWLLLLLIIPAEMIIIPLHELGHALTAKHFGRDIHRFGVGWYWLGPVAFADTSDMWLCHRGPRFAVNLAGIYVNIIVSGVLGIVSICLISSFPLVGVYLWLVAFMSYLFAFYNLDPTFELDGYYVLMDALDKPNLRTQAVRWLVEDSKKTFQSITLIKKFFPEMIYWIVSLTFIVLIAFIAYIVQVQIINNMLPETIGPINLAEIKWLLAFVLIMMSFASLYSSVKHQAAMLNQKVG